jgi:hypothetical protein
MIGDGDCGETGGMKIGRGNRSTRSLVFIYIHTHTYVEEIVLKTRVFCFRELQIYLVHISFESFV